MNVRLFRFTLLIILVLFLPFKHSPFFELTSLNLLAFWLYFDWIKYMYFVISNFKTKRVDFKIVWACLLLLLIPSIWYFTTIEQKWWEMVDAVPRNEIDESLAFNYHLANYLVIVLPFVISLTGLVFLNSKATSGIKEP